MNLTLDVSQLHLQWMVQCMSSEEKSFRLVNTSVPALGLCAGRKTEGLTWPLHCSGADTGSRKGGSPTDTLAFYNEGLVLTADDIEKHSACVLPGNKVTA